MNVAVPVKRPLRQVWLLWDTGDLVGKAAYSSEAAAEVGRVAYTKKVEAELAAEGQRPARIHTEVTRSTSRTELEPPRQRFHCISEGVNMKTGEVRQVPPVHAISAHRAVLCCFVCPRPGCASPVSFRSITMPRPARQRMVTF
jgi:hypothetical protein